MEILFADRTLAVCVKPAGILSTDEPGGLPELLRRELGEENVRTVHRLDRVVGGVMVLGRTKRAAAELSEQLRQDHFGKEYLAAVAGTPADSARLRHFLHRDKAARKTFAVPEGTPESQEAILEYTRLETAGETALLRVRLFTGRTHQIRCQLAREGLPILGDGKYGGPGELPGGIGLWSCRLSFTHPRTGERLSFFCPPPPTPPWTAFSTLHEA